jgi:uncharacterized protein YyaL (SSP411 family)
MIGNQKTSKNKLRFEKSPYLLQHANNPVNWYSWTDEAFKDAKDKNKPIFLSIGYSTCHWCHVMAHESFEDESVAKILNKNFICIKVDREERPDIDNIYMKYCQMITGSGGWPLTIIMTPDKKPFFAATYIPKKGRFGQNGMLEILPKIIKLWYNDKDKIIESSKEITNNLRIQLENQNEKKRIDKTILDQAYESLLTSYDELYGGFNIAPKFPTPHNLLFLLRYWKKTNSKYALKMVEQTLTNMYQGGIYDHIGFGFHRYSTDRQWLLPHFEKMLYDQAMLIIIYTEAYQATKNPLFKIITEEIISYIIRDLKSNEGGFYSAEDADSEGVEGKYYTWSYKELQKKLTKNEFEIIEKIFTIKKEGNFLEESSKKLSGKNVIFQNELKEELKEEIKKKDVKASDEINKILSKMYQIRSKRIPPLKDDKILTDWNGLIIAALAKAGFVFNKDEYVDIAENTADFILKNLYKKNTGLLHRYKDGESAITGFADDYAFFIFGLIELYQSNHKTEYLSKALDLNDFFIKHFWDEKGKGFQFIYKENQELLNTKEIYDGAIPSSNSVSVMNLLKLSRITGYSIFEEMANQIINTFSMDVIRYPNGYTFLLSALDFAIGPTSEIIIIEGKNKADTNKFLNEIRNKYLPNLISIKISNKDEKKSIMKLCPYLKNYKLIENKTTVYLCENHQCKKPTTKANNLKELLK